MNGELDRLDAAIVDMVATLELAGIRIGAERDGSAVTLTGAVDSREDRQAVFDVARATLMRAGARVVDAIEVPDERDEQERNEQAGRSSGRFAWTGAPDDLPRSADFSAAEFDPDFTDDAGATDPKVAAAERVPWFPPTDSVVGPSDDGGDLRMPNGFAATGDAPDVPPGAPALDERLNARVLRALADDALTTDVAITAHTRGGVVHLRGEAPTLEDAKNAEAVAASVEGVNEVRESLRVGSIRDRASRSGSRQLVHIGPQALIWFGISAGAAAFAMSALWRRFVKKDPQAIRSGAGFILFVVCLLLFAVGGLLAGIVNIRTAGGS